MEKELRLNVITPLGIEYDAHVRQVTFSESDGLISFLKDYAPTIGKIERGILKIVDLKGLTSEYIVDDGVFSVADNLLKIISNFCTKNNEAEMQKIITMRQNSLDILNSKNKNDVIFKTELQLFQKIKEIKEK